MKGTLLAHRRHSQLHATRTPLLSANANNGTNAGPLTLNVNNGTAISNVNIGTRTGRATLEGVFK